MSWIDDNESEISEALHQEYDFAKLQFELTQLKEQLAESQERVARALAVATPEVFEALSDEGKQIVRILEREALNGGKP